MAIKNAATDHPILKLLAERWSPYGFEDRPVAEADLRSLFEAEAWTALAIGYKADPAKLPDALKERDLAPRQRKPLSKFVFTGQWGQPSPLVLKRDT